MTFSKPDESKALNKSFLLKFFQATSVLVFLNLSIAVFVRQHAQNLFAILNLTFLAGSYLSAAAILFQRNHKRLFPSLSQIALLLLAYLALMIFIVYVVGSTHAG